MRVQFNDIAIDLSPKVCHTIYQHVQQAGLPEAGGILLGKYYPKEKIYFITEATIPTDEDECGPTYFIRHSYNAQEIINARWKTSSGTINYLGEWHTHGCDIPTPSNVDRCLVQSIYDDKSNVWPVIILIILGRKACYIGISNNSSRGEITESINIEGDHYALIFH